MTDPERPGLQGKSDNLQHPARDLGKYEGGSEAVVHKGDDDLGEEWAEEGGDCGIVELDDGLGNALVICCRAHLDGFEVLWSWVRGAVKR